MALYHFHADILSRKKGHSACSAAAYRAGEEIHSEYSGETYDYRRKQYVEYSVVMLPENAPAEYIDRETLWNSVECNERQVNAQLARILDVASPRELSFDDQKELALSFVEEHFVSQGMCADVCFHNPPLRNSRGQPINVNGNVTRNPEEYIYNNPHFHVMLPLRSIDEYGKWEPKFQKLYICEKDGEQRLFSPSELKQAEGWEKIYNYTDADGHKQWLTKSFVKEHPECGYKQVNKYPKSIQQENPKLTVWNSPETYVGWREAWAEKVNLALELHGYDEKVTHLSYADQGLDFIPTVHEGKAVTIAEKRLKEEYDRKVAAGEEAILQHTEIRNLNLAIKEHNQELKIIYHIQKLKQQMEEFLKPIHTRIDIIGASLAERLEHLRCEIISISVKIKEAFSLKETVSEKIKYDQEYIDALHPMREERLKALQATLIRYEEEYLKLNPLYRNKRVALQEKIDLTEHELSIQQQNAKYASDAASEIRDLTIKANALDTEIHKLSSLKKTKTTEYESLKSSISSYDLDRIKEDRLRIRPEIEAKYDDSKKYKYVKEAELFDRKYDNISDIETMKIKVDF